MTTELSWAAQEVVYKIRHVIKKAPLDDALALRHARALIFRPVMGVSPDEEYNALVEALHSDASLSTWRGDPGFERVLTESDFRAHLQRVIDRLDRMRPWPIPLFRVAVPETWREYRDPCLVGIIRLGVRKVENRIHAHLLPVTTDGVQHRVAILILRSGREIAVVGSWWPGDRSNTAVLTCDPDASAEELMAELTSGDHFEPGEYEVVHAES